MRINVDAHEFQLMQLPRVLMDTPYDTLRLRHDDVQHISTLLAQSTHLCIIGLPGIGKSSLARLIATASIHHYDAVLCHTFGTSHLHVTDVYDKWLHCLLDCTQAPSDIVPDAHTLYSILAQFPRRLVILDDIYDVAHIEAISPALPPGTTLLITTRYPQIANAGQFNQYHLGNLHGDDAVALLAHRLAKPVSEVRTWKWVPALITAVDSHPLAIELAAQRLRILSNDPAEWYDFVTPLHAGITQHMFSDFAEHPDIATGFIPLLKQQYDSLNPIERQILHGMAVCDPNYGTSTRLLMAMWHLDETQITDVMQRLCDTWFVRATPHGWTQQSIMHAYTRMIMQQHNSESHLRNTLHNALLQILNTCHTQRTYAEFAQEYDQCVATILAALTHDIQSAVSLSKALTLYTQQVGKYWHVHTITRKLLPRVQHDDDDALLTQTYALCAMTALDCAVHIGQKRAEYLDQGYIYLQEAIHLNPNPHNLISAELTMQIGIVLSEIATLPGPNTLQHIETALEFYASALNAPGLSTTLYVQLCINTANVHLQRAEYLYPQSEQDCQRAIDFCEKGLKFLPTSEKVHLFVGIYKTLSSAYSLYATLPNVDAGAYLYYAKLNAHEALTRIDETQQPHDYARMLMNYANLCSELSTYPDVDQLAYAHEALESFQESLEYRTEATVPLEYAWTQHNYADTLRIAANITGEPTMEHFHAAWVAIHEALRFRTRHEIPWHHALSHYVRAHIAMEYAEALIFAQHSSEMDEQIALAVVNAGLESYQVVNDMRSDIGFSDSMLFGISDYASMLYGLRAWIQPDMAHDNLREAFELNDFVHEQYPPDAHDDQAEVLAHRIQLLHWSWMLGHATTDIVPDVRAAERLCDMPLRPIIACQLHMRLAIMGYDITLAEHSRGPVYHHDRAKHYAQRLSYAPVARALG